MELVLEGGGGGNLRSESLRVITNIMTYLLKPQSESLAQLKGHLTYMSSSHVRESSAETLIRHDLNK